MAESKSIGEWQEWVKSCNESGKSKAADGELLMPWNIHLVTLTEKSIDDDLTPS